VELKSFKYNPWYRVKKTHHFLARVVTMYNPGVDGIYITMAADTTGQRPAFTPPAYP
jgi:hypothetical protein